MNKLNNEDNNILDLAHVLTASGEAFAYATVIRTAGATSAKPGSKAIISSEGQILKELQWRMEKGNIFQNIRAFFINFHLFLKKSKFLNFNVILSMFFVIKVSF